MYSIVYVLTDHGERKYFWELMVSLQSVSIHDSLKRIFVVTDEKTYLQLEEPQKKDIEKYASILHFEVGNQYSEKEVSRWLKVNLRNLISGDFLFIDTDTIICDRLPDFVSASSFAAVLNGNTTNSSRRYPSQTVDKRCGLGGLLVDNYLNSGVIWAKDTELCREIYRKWSEKWEETRKTGHHMDQPALNYVLKQYQNDIEILDAVWNTQISNTCYFPIQSFDRILILHYFHNPRSPYQFCKPEVKTLAYNDPAIMRMIENPKRCFEPVLIMPTEGFPVFSSELFHLLLNIYRHPQLFSIINGMLAKRKSLKSILNGFIKKRKKQS